MAEYVATFRTHYDALMFMRRLQALGIAGKLAPVPRALSTSCGTCALFEADAPPAALADAELEQLARKDGKGYAVLIDRR